MHTRILSLCLLIPSFASACADDEGGDDMDMSAHLPMTDGGAAPAQADDDDIDNVAACERLVDDLSCGGVDLGASLGCAQLAEMPCDLAPYFDCVADAFSCVDGVPDTSGLTMCVELATCQ